MINGKYTLKKLLAFCLTFALAAGSFGLSGRDLSISGSADEQTEEYEEELNGLKLQQEALDKKIEEAQAEIDKQKDDLKALEAKYTAVKAKIDNVEEQLVKNEDAMVELDSRLREARHDLEVKNGEIDVMRSDFMARIKTMYVAGGVNTYEKVLINSADFYDVLMRLELVKRVAEHDDRSLDELMEKKREIEAVEAQIEKDSKKLSEQAAEYSDMREELLTEKKSLDEIIQAADGKLDTLALDKAAMELRASQLSDEYDSAYSRAHTTTTTVTAPPEPEVVTEETDPEESVEAVTSAPVTEQEIQSDGETAADPEEDEPVSTTAATEAPVVTEPPMTETEPPETAAAQPEPQPVEDSSRQSRIDKVLDYARSNVGGAYVWGGSSFRATDCSGLVMLSYGQIGVSLPHMASSQAGYGTSVSYGELQEGDLVFFGYGSISSIYHVAIYSGNGRIIHAANTSDGIIISDLASFSKYNPIVAMRRII